MARNIFPIIKNTRDRSRYLPKIHSLVYPPANTIIEVRCSSEALMTSSTCSSFVVRPDTIYTERLLNILINPANRILSSVHHILMNGAYSPPSSDRPRILKMFTDAELLAYSLSTHHVTPRIAGRKTRKMHVMKKTIDADRAIYSVELAIKKLRGKHIVVVPRDNSIPSTLQGRHDLIYMDVPVLTTHLAENYLDRLTLISKKFMVVCPNIESRRILQRYICDEIADSSGNNPLYVVRNYNV